MSDKLLVEEHLCLNCKRTYRIVVIEESVNLTKTDKRLLKNDGIFAIKKGEKFKCPHCGHKVEVK
ncbi:MAG: hypothetical protein A2Y82_04950 [Candidatus Buchananbacteria bacterium RBG_13_36_9]|uniref:CpXC domain-containing protein n=1 Tax=Candidatus Buchananbacteria bacterium RBG_13_36_9 TaxID=1797530 RepID=A0A1G1XQF6_9BACT|nr:MAG: hypothetical protein A2Y82_04950 [Candidatus Buchananbacteria bacterium RBG_13_36_9]